MKRQFKAFLASALCFGWLLGIKNGYVALWRDDDPHPEQIYDIRADTLPAADQLLLRRGIAIATREELWQILEDYM